MLSDILLCYIFILIVFKVNIINYCLVVVFICKIFNKDVVLMLYLLKSSKY